MEELLMQLPEDVRHLAIANLDTEWSHYTPDPRSTSIAVNRAFKWSNTLEGHGFWESVHKDQEVRERKIA